MPFQYHFNTILNICKPLTSLNSTTCTTCKRLFSKKNQWGEFLFIYRYIGYFMW